MAKNDKSKDDAPAVTISGPELTLPPGTINTTLDLADMAKVLATNLRRKLRFELEKQTVRVKEFTAPLDALNKRFEEAAQAQADNAVGNVTAAKDGIYTKAQTCVAALQAFNGAESTVAVAAQPGVTADARKGAGCVVTVTWGIKYPKTESYRSASSSAHTENVEETLPATPLMVQLVAEIDQQTAAKNEAVKLAADLAAQLRRPDLDAECHTLVIERAMERNPQTAAWLEDLYGRLGLAVDSSSVRKQLELAD